MKNFSRKGLFGWKVAFIGSGKNPANYPSNPLQSTNLANSLSGSNQALGQALSLIPDAEEMGLIADEQPVAGQGRVGHAHAAC